MSRVTYADVAPADASDARYVFGDDVVVCLMRTQACRDTRVRRAVLVTALYAPR